MLGNQEFVDVVVNEIYPRAKELQELCRKLYVKQFPPALFGPMGVNGSNEADFALCYLRAAINMLEAVKKEQLGER